VLEHAVILTLVGWGSSVLYSLIAKRFIQLWKRGKVNSRVLTAVKFITAISTLPVSITTLVGWDTLSTVASPLITGTPCNTQPHNNLYCDYLTIAILPSGKSHNNCTTGAQCLLQLSSSLPSEHSRSPSQRWEYEIQSPVLHLHWELVHATEIKQRATSGGLGQCLCACGKIDIP